GCGRCRSAGPRRRCVRAEISLVCFKGQLSRGATDDRMSEPPMTTCDHRSRPRRTRSVIRQGVAALALGLVTTIAAAWAPAFVSHGQVTEPPEGYTGWYTRPDGLQVRVEIYVRHHFGVTELVGEFFGDSGSEPFDFS